MNESLHEANLYIFFTLSLSHCLCNKWEEQELENARNYVKKQRVAPCVCMWNWVVYSLGMWFQHNYRKHFSGELAKKRTNPAKVKWFWLVYTEPERMSESWIWSNFVDAGGVNVLLQFAFGYSVCVCVYELQLGIIWNPHLSRFERKTQNVKTSGKKQQQQYQHERIFAISHLFVRSPALLSNKWKLMKIVS